ncbi:GntR family trehalose operon transcriptional repressor [Alkalicoccobacillus murimartini]|uniref:Trehalose operon repressor n=1 Tax=Alkalicoccobacillus murimartini TaxID=171685 RepID=A0ABT9YL63_9BACI|nr:GntR family trehalose operon transcriptional repressor [Alkalicoccobacillus murimartini]
MKSKFQLVYEELANQIQKGEWRPEELLPSELELVKTYQASRETIRKALKLLSERGYIQKIQGKGSVVLDRSKIDFPFSGVSSFKELSERMNMKVETDVVAFDEVIPDLDLQDKLQLTSEQHALRIKRVRKVDGERVILDKDDLVSAVVPGLTAKISQNSIYEYLEKELGLIISFAKKEIVVEEPTVEDRALLDLDSFTNVVVVRGRTYLDDARIFQYTESRHRPDKFRFVNFARREQL